MADSDVRAGDYRCVVCGSASFVAAIRPDGLCKWCRRELARLVEVGDVLVEDHYRGKSTQM